MMKLPWGNGLWAYVGLLALVGVIVVIGGKVVIRRSEGAPTSSWEIAYGIAALMFLIAFNVWFFLYKS